MARYYAEGTIKEIALEDKTVEFSLDPAKGFFDEFQEGGAKRIRFIGKEVGDWWQFYEGKFVVNEPGTIKCFLLAIIDFLQVNRNHKLPVRIYVEKEDIGEGSSMAEVKRLEIKE